jgi:hypothetical protein
MKPACQGAGPEKKKIIEGKTTSPQKQSPTDK